MLKQTIIDLADPKKPLYEWAEGEFFENRGQVSQFLSFIKREGKEPIDVVSYVEFLTLKEKFEAGF